MKGHIVTKRYDHGRLVDVIEVNNLVVDLALTSVAYMIGGHSGSYAVNAVGFGTGTGAPAPGDTQLSSSGSRFFRAFDSVSYPTSSQVQFAWSIDGGRDASAVGVTINEMGLFCNTAALTLPATIANSGPAWAGTHAYVVGNTIRDGGGNIHVCSVAGTSGGSTPSWNTGTDNATTTDGGVTWKCLKTFSTSLLLFARALVGLGTLTSGTAYTSAWTITV